MTSDHFPAALSYLLGDEKGFVDNPADKGGPTKWGVTMATLARWRRRPVTRDDVRDLTATEAAQIYYAWYWKPLGCDKLSQPSIATILLDAGVLFGVGTSAVAAQKAARASGAGPSLAVDGHVGPATVAALNSCDARRFGAAFADALVDRIGRICAARPADEEFRSGWTSRARRLANITI